MKSNRKYFSIMAMLLGLLIFCGMLVMENRNQRTRAMKIIYVPKIEDSANDFWTSLMEGARMAAKEYDVDFQVFAPSSENDYQGQMECIQRAIEEHPNAIMLSPSSYTEITEAARKIVDAGIKLVLVDSAMDENLQSAIVATDNFEAGEKLGGYVREHIEGEPVIGIVAHVQGSSTAINREEGFREGLGEYEDCVVDTVFCDSDYEKAYRVTQDLLKRYPDINILAGLNEYSALGAARAVRDMKLSDQIHLVGFDSSLEQIQMLEEGLFDAMVIQQPFNMGYLGVETAVSVIRGEAVAPEVDSGSELITRENMYTDENQKLLFPFVDE